MPRAFSPSGPALAAPLAGHQPPQVVLSQRFQVDDLVIHAPEGLIRPVHLAVLANGGYEAAEIALATAMIGPGQRVLEFGGGIGVVSRHIARITGPDCVLSVEANPQALATARALVGRDGLGVTHLWGMVVSGRAQGKTGRLMVDPQNFLASHPGTPDAPDHGARQIDCPALNLSDLLRDWQPQVLVVDIEGAERDLFAVPDLSAVQALILELHPGEIGVDGCLRVLEVLRSHGLLPDAGLVGGAVLGFVRNPRRPVPQTARFARLFQSLADPGAGPDRASVASEFPDSPLMTLRALTLPPPHGPGRAGILETLARNPMTARTATRLLAQDALAQGNNDGALALIGASPLGMEAQIAAIAHLRQKRLPEALTAVQRAVTALPHAPQARLLTARILLAQGDRPAARAATAAAHGLDPATPGLAAFVQHLAALPD